MPGVSPTRTSLRPPGPRPRAQSRSPRPGGPSIEGPRPGPALLHPERRRGTPKQAGSGLREAEVPGRAPAGPARRPCIPRPRTWPPRAYTGCRTMCGSLPLSGDAGRDKGAPGPAAAARAAARFTQLGRNKGRRLIAARPVGGPRAGGARVSPGARGGPPEGWPRPLTESPPPAGAREGVRRATGTRGWKKGGSSGGGVGAPSLQDAGGF